MSEQIQARRFARLSKRRSRINDNYPTPKSLYDEYNAEFHFNADPCPINPDGLRDNDGLGIPESCESLREWVNPPYSKKIAWIDRAIEVRKRGGLDVMLLPVDPSTSWFLDRVVPNLTEPTIGKDIRFIRGRVQFDPNRGNPAFASMVCIFRPKDSHEQEPKR